MTLARSFYSTQTTAFDYLQARAPREMWASVLKQAIEDAVNGPSQFECARMTLEQAREYRCAVHLAAEEWIADEESEPRRFVWVCEQLDMDPARVREEIERRKHVAA
jgi:hypothetical protein